MQQKFQEAFNEHYKIDDETFKVVFLIISGAKLDAGMMPYHVLEIQKLPDLTKYLFHKGEAGLQGGYSIVKYEDTPTITWTDEVHRQLLNSIRNEKLPTRFFINPGLSNGFF